MEVGVQAQGSSDLPTRSDLITEPVERIAERGRRLGVVGSGRRGLGEPVSARGVETLSVKRTSHGQHELDIVLEAHGGDTLEQAERRFLLTESEQRLTEAHQAVLVPIVEDESTLECLPRPRIFLPGQTSVAQPHT